MLVVKLVGSGRQMRRKRVNSAIDAPAAFGGSQRQINVIKFDCLYSPGR